MAKPASATLQALDACRQEGFVAADACRLQCERREFSIGPAGERTVDGRTDHLMIRAFWERGDPLAIALSDPRAREVKRAIAEAKASVTPGPQPSFFSLLPEAPPSLFPSTDDPLFSRASSGVFSGITEKCECALAGFGGLESEGIDYSAQRQSVEIANSKGLHLQFARTLFSLRLHLRWQEHRLEIGEAKVFVDRLSPERLVARAFNLLQSLARKSESPPAAGGMILSPEASTTLLRELVGRFRADGRPPKPRQWLGAAPITLIDSPLLDGEAGSAPCDDEGVAGSEKTLIDKGMFNMAISNLQTAWLGGGASTGNGYRDDVGSPPGVRFSNLFFKPSPLSLSDLMAEAGSGVLVSMMRFRAKGPAPGDLQFSAYGFSFRGGETAEPVHLYIQTSYRSFWPRVLRVSRELRFFQRRGSIGSPYLLVEAAPGPQGAKI